ncbi:hypothetical protein AB0O76_19195 [Streptomyces sp. NPDC086554]|uniref:hypothetical protein n=1 Tax=Streptomyces sp. NPDC086554 TaxID=3154864 RepID=UPI003433D216
MLLAFLEDLELYLGIAFTILALFGLLMLFPPAGLALAGGGVAAGAAGSLGAAEVSALGVSGVVLMVQGSQSSGGGGSTPSQSSGSGKGSGAPPWLRDRWRKGDQFNRDNWHRYPQNEITLENGKRLDSYRPGKEIVSRKARSEFPKLPKGSAK